MDDIDEEPPLMSVNASDLYSKSDHFSGNKNKELFLFKNAICDRYLGKNKTNFNSNVIQKMLLESLLLANCTVLFLCTISMMLVSLNDHGSFLAEQRMALMVELVYSISLRIN